MGPSPITYPDMMAYFGMHGIKPTHFELSCIRKLDRVYLESTVKKEPDAKQAKPRKPRK